MSWNLLESWRQHEALGILGNSLSQQQFPSRIREGVVQTVNESGYDSSQLSLTDVYLMKTRSGNLPLLKPQFHLIIQHIFWIHLEESRKNNNGPIVPLQLDLSSALML